MKTVFIYCKAGPGPCQPRKISGSAFYVLRWGMARIRARAYRSGGLALDGIAVSCPGGVAREKCPYVGIACLFCRDCGLKAGRSTVSAAIKNYRSVLAGRQECSDDREVLLGDVHGPRYVAGQIFKFAAAVDNNKISFFFHRRFELFYVEVLDGTGKETACLDYKECNDRQYGQKPFDSRK